MHQSYRTRFAPSPTGEMHLGHARTALLTWLRARSRNGVIVMRVEDIDRPRIVPGAAEAICREHEWLGLDWDEGPFFQSDREARYEQALQALDRKGLLFPCTCSRKDIAEAASAPHGEDGPVYPGTCRQGPTKPSRAAAMRFCFAEPSPGFTDLFHGDLAPGLVSGDFVVRRADGLWAYQLAVVVDDASMGITEVIRGDDLLLSTPRQLALYDALGYRPPDFAHIGLVTDPSGTRLSKRHGATAIRALREGGASREQILGWLARSLGIQTDTSPVTASDLLSSFDVNDLTKGSVFADS